ncbi:HTTM domain-containing protein [Aquimarina sp. ERC-38]|uniref:HTTM domain-containing protein n=1 Tax=Aquimarina sp. ERC-38 TaxID=2949996 RepID=UPI002245ED27|nr:HTTM domain-containing protein [Aquimarina sp. ERC-38]UZO81339.1 HTTM domain-containing protein [Aquimarina sp. ERC-38]
MNRWLFTKIDNSALVVFRIIFGFLIAAESFGAIATGWVRKTLIEPRFTFNFIGFDFLQPLPGNGMYFYFAIMGILGVLVMIGYKYKASMIGFSVLWAGVYLMQKSSYNNHYYLLMLLNFLMCLLPAHRYASVYVKINPELKQNWMPSWCVLIIIFQLWIVYTYAAIAKIYPDWLDYTVAKNLMSARAQYPIIGNFLQQHWVHIAITYFGILFDLLVIPLLLWKRSRWFAFITGIFFHLFNSIVFQIGIFPYLSLAFCLFFFPKKKVQQWFLPRKEFYDQNEVVVPSYRNVLVGFATIWFMIQIALPLRHWLIPGDVLWTEEGHRLSWRMMLRGKSGRTSFYVVEKDSSKPTKIRVNQSDYLTQKQQRRVASKPDMIWQFAQYLKKEYQKQGKDIAVYVTSRVSVNRKKSQPLIDPQVDLTSVPWNHFTTNPWVIKYDTHTVKN